MDILTKIFAFLFTILVLVSIHEAGHMFVARLLKIKVLRYSIGFGTPIWNALQRTESICHRVLTAGWLCQIAR